VLYSGYAQCPWLTLNNNDADHSITDICSIIAALAFCIYVTIKRQQFTRKSYRTQTLQNKYKRNYTNNHLHAVNKYQYHELYWDLTNEWPYKKSTVNVHKSIQVIQNKQTAQYNKMQKLTKSSSSTSYNIWPVSKMNMLKRLAIYKSHVNLLHRKILTYQNSTLK